MRICFVTDSFPIPPRHGVELPIAYYMEALARCGHSVSCAVVLEAGAGDAERQRARAAPDWVAGVFIVAACRRPLWRRAFDEAVLRRPAFFALELDVAQLRTQFARTSFDWIWISPVGLLPFADAYGTAVRADARVILGVNDAHYTAYFEHGLAGLRGHERLSVSSVSRLFRAPLIALHERQYLQRADTVHVQTEPEHRRLSRLFTGIPRPPRIVVAPNGARKELLALPLAAGVSPRVLCIAHFLYGRERQLLHFLDRVWKRVREVVPQATLVLTGIPPSLGSHEAIRAYPGVEHRGFVDPYVEAFRDVALAAIPIRQRAGLINRAIDALAAGVPIVGYRQTLSSIDGFVPDQHGFAVDDDAAFAEAIRTLLLSPSLRSRLADAGRMLVRDRYAWERSAQAVEAALHAPDIV